MNRLLLGGLLAVVVLGCGGSTPATNAPGGATTAPGGATTAPGGQQATPAGPAAPTAPGGGAAGGAESIARSLVPTGALELSHAQVGNNYALQLSSALTLQQLEAFWDQKIPSTGMTQTGKFESQGAVTYAFTNPDGGIVASPDGSGNFIIQISIGVS